MKVFSFWIKSILSLLSDFVYQPADQEKEKETDYDGGTGGNIQKGRKE